MRAGKLDRSIAIQRLTETVGGTGAVTQQWEIVAVLRAELVSLAHAEAGAAFGEADTGTVVLRTRYLAGITTADRVMFEGTPHNLKGIVEIGRRRGLELRIGRTA